MVINQAWPAHQNQLPVSLESLKAVKLLTLVLSPIASLQLYSTHKESYHRKEHYTCTLCWRSFQKPCHTVGSDSRIVCVDRWRWMYDLGVCWACGGVAFRKEDAISFSLCW